MQTVIMEPATAEALFALAGYVAGRLLMWWASRAPLRDVVTAAEAAEHAAQMLRAAQRVREAREGSGG